MDPGGCSDLLFGIAVAIGSAIAALAFLVA